MILPGLLCDARMFGGQIAAFNARVIEGFYGCADRIEAMADYALDRLPPRCALLGHSMGARVALAIWEKAPGRIERLALASTGVHPVGQHEAASRYRLRDLGRARGEEALVDAWLPPMIGDARRQDPVLYGALRAMCVDAGLETFTAQTEAMLHRPPLDRVCAGVNCPTLVVVGRLDTWSPVAQHETIAAAIPGARLRVLEGAGHMAPAEDPIGFNEIVRDWLSWPVRRRAVATTTEG